jgi:hypothetical protein
VNRTLKLQRDFGIRRWLADTGCGHDLVQTSLVVRERGEAYIRLRAPKYLTSANGLTSITKEMTMYLPQLDEMAEMLCCPSTPSDISIGKRCLEGGYAFHWPPYSQHPFFIKPDGTRVIMDVEGNIPYLMGGGEYACVGEEDVANTDYDDDDDDVPVVAHYPGMRRAKPAPVKDSSVGHTDTPSVDAEPTGQPIPEDPWQLSPDDMQRPNISLGGGLPLANGCGSQIPPISSGDIGPVYSRGFRDVVNEAFALRRLATHKPNLDSCDTCRRAKAIRMKHVRSHNKAESRVHKSMGPPPEKFGNQVILDHILARNELNWGCKGEASSLTLMDRATGFRWARGSRTTLEERVWRSSNDSKGQCPQTRSCISGRTMCQR